MLRLWERLLKVPGFLRWRFSFYLQNTRFDRRYGVETSRIEREYLRGMDVADIDQAQFYEAVTPDFFRRMVRVIGVELSEDLHLRAGRNVEQFDRSVGRTSGIQLARGDATEFELPGGDWVVFLYNPFSGRMMKRVVESLEGFVRSGRGRILIWYGTPKELHRFDDSPAFEQLHSEQAFPIYRSVA